MSLTDDRRPAQDYVPAGDRELAAAHPLSHLSRQRVQNAGITHPWLVPALLFGSSAAVWTVAPVLGFLLLVAALTVLWSKNVSAAVAVVAAPAALMLAWAAFGQLMAVTDLPLLTTRIGWALGWVLLVAVVAIVGQRAMGLLARPRPGIAGPGNGARVHRRLSRWMWAPSAALTLVAVFQSMIFDRVSGWIGLGTDTMQQVLLIQQMNREGALGISTNSGWSGNLTYQVYPKGLHWLVAAVLGPVVDPSQLNSAEAYSLFLRVYAGFVWLALAVMLCVAASFVGAAVRRRSLASAVAPTAMGVLTLMVVLVSELTYVTVLQGGMASSAAVAAVWSLWWVGVSEPRLRVRLTVLAVALFVTANAWQPIALVVLVTGAAMLLPHGRELWRAARSAPRSRGLWWTVGLGSATYVVVTATPITSLLLARGDKYATIPGAMPMSNIGIIVAEGVLVLGWSVRSMRQHKSLLLRTGWGMVAGSALAWSGMVLATRGDIGAYYPLKVLWFVTIFGWPVLVMVAGVLLVAAARRAAPWVVPAWRAVVRRPASWAAAIGVALLMLAAGLPWAMTFPPQMAILAGGMLAPSPEVAVGLLPASPGRTYAPYGLSSSWDRPWLKELIAAKALAFRFDTQYMDWMSSTNRCAILRRESPVTIVTVVSRTDVAQLLKKNGCHLTDWEYRFIGGPTTGS